MRRSMISLAAIPALLIGLAVAAPARAASTDPAVCRQRISEAWQAWRDSDIPTSNLRAALSVSAHSHDHPAMVTRWMQGQLAEASYLCRQGEEHEALLRVDAVRTWLKLPFEEHPASHDYHPATHAS